MARFPLLSEDDMETILATYPRLIEEGLTLVGRQMSVGRVRVDLLFKDKFGDILVVEGKSGTVKREHVGQIMEYLGTLYDGKPIRLMLIGNRVPPALRNALEYHGIEWREIPQERFVEFLRNNDLALLKQLMEGKSPITPPLAPTPSVTPTRPALPMDVKNAFQRFKQLRGFVAGEGIVEMSVDSWHEERRSAKERYARLFGPGHLRNVTAEEFDSFLYFANNRAWTNLYRRGKAATEDMNALKQAIAYLQDETQDIRTRINSVLLGGPLHVNGFGQNLATAILHVCDVDDKYGVWNNRTEGGLGKLGRLPRRIYNDGEYYYRINEELNRLKRELGIDLIMIDSFIWYVDKYLLS